MVLAAQHVRHAHRDVVDHRGEQVEPAAVGAADDGIGEVGGIEALLAPNAVDPGDRRGVIELEAPVRLHPLPLQPRAIGIAERERGAIVDRRQAAAGGDLALEVQLLRALIGGIDPARGAQPGELRLIEVVAIGLAHHRIRLQPQPAEIGQDRIGERLGGPLRIGIVEPQQEAPAPHLGQQPIVQRQPDVADMEPAGGRGSEAGDGHGRPLHRVSSKSDKADDAPGIWS